MVKDRTAYTILGTVLVLQLGYVGYRLTFPKERPPGPEYHYERVDTPCVATPYVTAATASPMVIEESNHKQGRISEVLCFSDGEVSLEYGGIIPSGYLLPCNYSRDTYGNVTIAFEPGSVKTIEVVKRCY